jgi:cyclopropane fatty-acyl-phospholipid synthase-like methyltransferase
MTQAARTLTTGRSILVLTLVCQSVLCIQAQSPAPASPAMTSSPAAATHPTETRKTSEPYTGDLSIFDSPGRDERLQINRVMKILDVSPGKVVADIGAGSGWYTVRAAKRVTETGLVYAVEINPEAIRYIDQRIQKEGLHNVKTILSKPDDPLLPASKIDSVLLLKTYHEVAEPVTLLRNLRASLRTGAKVGVIDRNGNGENHGVARDAVIREASQAGYTLQEQYDFVKGDGMDYFLVFTAK